MSDIRKSIINAKNASNDRGTYILASLVSELAGKIEELNERISRLEKWVEDLDYSMHLDA